MLNLACIALLNVLSIEAFRNVVSSPSKLYSQNIFDTSLNAGNAVVTIGTRGSPLALAQAYETKRLLGLHFSELAVEGAVEIQKIMTKVYQFYLY